MTYYTSIILLSLLSLAVLCILISENERIKKKHKLLYYFTYLLIALSALAEWTGVRLNGVETLPKWPLMLAKCADYILTPLAGGALIEQMRIRNKWSKALLILLCANTVFQIAASFGGWMVRIDEHNHYTHGPLYFVYVLVYLAVIATVILQFVLYGKKFRKQNRFSLYAIMALILLGIAAQEIFGSEYRTSYIALSIGAILLYIHYAEFFRIASEDKLREQEILLSTDSLTGLFNRYAYAKMLENYEKGETIPADLCAFSIDINGLKAANDTLGHAVGDELICGAADCIKRVFKKTGKCYRTGGDEFIVFARLDKEKALDALSRLKTEAAAWTGKGIDELGLAAGVARAEDHPGVSAEKLVIEADRAMYAEKDEFYRETGKNRRLI